MRVIYNKFLPFPGFCAMMLFGTIFARKQYKPLNKYVINHEEIHKAQAKDMHGFLFFYPAYLWDCIKHGYRKNKFEIEAYGHEYDLDYLKTREKGAWKHQVNNQNGVWESLTQMAKRLLKEEKKHIVEQLEAAAIELITSTNEAKKANTVARPKVKLKTAKAGNGNGVSGNGQTAPKSKKVQPKAKAQK